MTCVRCVYAFLESSPRTICTLNPQCFESRRSPSHPSGTRSSHRALSDPIPDLRSRRPSSPPHPPPRPACPEPCPSPRPPRALIPRRARRPAGGSGASALPGWAGGRTDRKISRRPRGSPPRTAIAAASAAASAAGGGGAAAPSAGGAPAPPPAPPGAGHRDGAARHRHHAALHHAAEPAALAARDERAAAHRCHRADGRRGRPSGSRACPGGRGWGRRAPPAASSPSGWWEPGSGAGSRVGRVRGRRVPPPPGPRAAAAAADRHLLDGAPVDGEDASGAARPPTSEAAGQISRWTAIRPLGICCTHCICWWTRSSQGRQAASSAIVRNGDGGIRICSCRKGVSTLSGTPPAAAAAGGTGRGGAGGGSRPRSRRATASRTRGAPGGGKGEAG